MSLLPGGLLCLGRCRSYTLCRYFLVACFVQVGADHNYTSCRYFLVACFVQVGTDHILYVATSWWPALFRSVQIIYFMSLLSGGLLCLGRYRSYTLCRYFLVACFVQVGADHILYVATFWWPALFRSVQIIYFMSLLPGGLLCLGRCRSYTLCRYFLVACFVQVGTDHILYVATFWWPASVQIIYFMSLLPGGLLCLGRYRSYTLCRYFLVACFGADHILYVATSWWPALFRSVQIIYFMSLLPDGLLCLGRCRSYTLCRYFLVACFVQVGADHNYTLCRYFLMACFVQVGADHIFYVATSWWPALFRSVQIIYFMSLLRGGLLCLGRCRSYILCRYFLMACFVQVGADHILYVATSWWPALFRSVQIIIILYVATS